MHKNISTYENFRLSVYFSDQNFGMLDHNRPNYFEISQYFLYFKYRKMGINIFLYENLHYNLFMTSYKLFIKFCLMQIIFFNWIAFQKYQYFETTIKSMKSRLQFPLRLLIFERKPYDCQIRVLKIVHGTIFIESNYFII